MAIEQGQTEGLKMIADWCKWAITVETGAIALIGSTAFKKEELAQLAHYVAGFGAVSIAAFALSMAVALLILSAIPTALQHIGAGMSVLDREVYAFRRPIGNIHGYAYVLGGLFLIGILAFGAAVTIQLLT